MPATRSALASRLAIAALCLAVAPLPAASQDPALVRDIAPGTGSALSGALVNAGGTLFFFADDGINGRHLWKSDGTFDGTVMVTDPATQDPFPSAIFQFTAAGARVYWVINTADGGRELWTSDGTSAGTVVARTLDSPEYFVETRGVGNVLYVSTSDGGLWACNGTAATLVREFDQAPRVLSDVGGTLYFQGYTAAAGWEPWKSNGSGATMVMDLFEGPESSYPGGFTAFDGKAYFVATPNGSGLELWRSNGTEAGTEYVAVIGSLFEPTVLVVAGPTLYFLSSAYAGREIWRTDGTAEGTGLLKDISPYQDEFDAFTAVGNTLFFVVSFQDSPTTRRFELWKSTGTEGSTVPVRVGVAFTGSVNRVALNGHLLFANGGYPEDGGLEPWTSDGSAAGTKRLADVYPGPTGSFPNRFTPIGPVAYFVASDGVKGVELWRTDGTEGGTTLVRDINEQGFSSEVRHMRNVNGTLYFSARNATVGRELWKSDGSEAGTTVVKDIAQNSLNADPVPLGTLGGQLIFRAWDHLTGGELWKTSGTTAGTVQVKDIRPGTAASMPDTVEGTVARDRVFFAADDGVAGRELWKTDGTPGGTVLVKDIAPGSAASNPTHLTTFGDRVFFLANDAASGTEVWVSDGTGPGTVRLKDIAPGAASGADEGPFVALGTTLFFRGNDGATGFELWKTDGTGAGTERVRDIRPGVEGSQPRELIASGGSLFFTAADGSTGIELWRSDGTAGGTVLVRDLSPGPADTILGYMADLNGRLLFTGWLDGGEAELWRSDGTSAGTVLVKDILPGSDSSVPLHTTVVHGRAYFAADDGETGHELWRSDGTAPGTVRVADIRSGEDSSSPRQFFAVGTTLYFAATGRASEGQELWRFDVTPSPPTLDVPTGAIAVGASNTVTGTNFTAGSVIKLFVATAGGAVAHGPYTPSAVTTTSLTWTIPASVPLGTGFVALQVINTDTGYLASNVVGALLIGGEVALVPTILTINGVGLAPPDLSIPVAHIDTVVAQGSTVTIQGTAFIDPVVNLFTAAGNVGPLFPLAGATPSRIQVVIPAAAPTGPGNFQVVNRPSYLASNAVASTLGAVPAITSVSAAGGVITVRGAGFSTLSVINLFNRQGGAAVNLGGLDGSTPRIPLTFVSDTEFTFVRPAGAVAGPSFVEVLNPPFIPFASSGTDPDGAFTMPLPPPLYTRMEGAAPSRVEGAAPSAPDESPMAGAAQSAPVTWTHASNAATNGTTLTSTGGRAWHAGARSTAALVTGDGAVTWRVRAGAGEVAFGLTHDDAAPTLADIDFAFRLDAATRELAIVEDGVTRHRAGPYAAGDRLQIAVRAGQVEYARNGQLLWTSTTAPRYPLVADASLGGRGATLHGVRLGGARLGATVTWARDEAVTVSSSRVTARRPATVTDAGPVVRAGPAGNRVQATLTGAAGLGLGAPDGSCTYCLVREDSAVLVVHAGTVRGTVPASAAATVRVEATPDGRVRYWVEETLIDEAHRTEDGLLGVRGVLRAPGAALARAVALSP